MTVPKIAHRVWFPTGPEDTIPPLYEDYWRRFADLHPAWELKTWSDPEELYPFMQNRELFDAFPRGRRETFAFRADVARYEILRHVGGLYLDTDTEPLRCFDPLLEDGRPFIAWCSDDELDPAVIASPPDHPAIRYLVDGLADVSPAAKSPPGTTGPRYVTPRWRYRDDVRRLPPSAFFPYHWTEMNRAGGPYPERSYAVHHWAAGWKSSKEARP